MSQRKRVVAVDKDVARMKGEMHTAALDFVNQEIRSQVKGHLDELRMIYEKMNGDMEEQHSAQEDLLAEISRLEEQQEYWKTQAEDLNERIEFGANDGEKQ